MKVEIYSQQIGRLHTSSDARSDGLKALMSASLRRWTSKLLQPDAQSENDFPVLLQV